MKTLLQKLALFGLTVILFTGLLSSCNEKEEMTRMTMAKLYDEEIIDLGNNSMTKTKGDEIRKAFSDCVRVNCNYRILDTAAIIDTAALRAFRDTAENLKGNNTGNHVLGFAMTYGLNTTNKKVNLLFKPVYIKKLSPIGVKVGATYSLIPGSDYYKYSSGSFVKANKTLAKEAIDNYRANIQFSDASHCRSFVDADDITGDVKFVLYPFQETDSIITAHQADSIYILHVWEKHSGYFKHGLLLGSSEISMFDQIFYGKYGDLSHLCPPSCNTITLNVK